MSESLDPFARFRMATRARIGLGRCGDSLPTAALLEFELAHARARDAVHSRVDFEAIAATLAPLPVVFAHSAAADRPICAVPTWAAASTTTAGRALRPCRGVKKLGTSSS